MLLKKLLHRRWTASDGASAAQAGAEDAHMRAPQLSAASLAAISELSQGGGAGVAASTRAAMTGSDSGDQSWTQGLTSGLRDLSARAVKEYLEQRALSSAGSLPSRAEPYGDGDQIYSHGGTRLNELSVRAVEEVKAGLAKSAERAWEAYMAILHEGGADEMATFRAYERWDSLKKELDHYK